MTSGLVIAIVGGGIGGFAAAVALRKNGHIVHVFEKSADNTEIGAGLSIQSNAIVALEYLEVERSSLRSVLFRSTASSDAVTGKSHEIEHIPKDTTVPTDAGFFVHREDLHSELKSLALDPDGDGTAVAVHLGSKIVSCDVEGEIVLESGEKFASDLIVGADGVRSVVRTHVLGYEQEACATGYACSRAVLSAEGIADIAELDWYTKPVPGLRVVSWIGEPFKMVISYGCRDGDLVNAIYFWQESEDEKSDPSSRFITPGAIRAKFPDSLPQFLRLLELPVQSSTGAIRRWRLRNLPILPTWTNGRALILGDAAHATFPFMGQGASMALEDAVALGCILRPGTTRDEVPSRLELWQKVRKPRGDFVNRTSVSQLASIIKGDRDKAHSGSTRELLLRYNVVEVARDAMASEGY
ncbi:unnamed protein product [Mycena citricolor]|uniref:FAD-binding domain-containing protein n=1 Tax=Mycena citricolor TaxID=2018698 RepID=A0AAD2H7G5_9AGAR|nr:unnamed protein product [Mycena citricolor]